DVRTGRHRERDRPRAAPDAAHPAPRRRHAGRAAAVARGYPARSRLHHAWRGSSLCAQATARPSEPSFFTIASQRRRPFPLTSPHTLSRRRAMNKTTLLRTLIAIPLLAMVLPAAAQQIRLIIPAPPGGGTDGFFRTVAQAAEEKLDGPL